MSNLSRIIKLKAFLWIFIFGACTDSIKSPEIEVLKSRSVSVQSPLRKSVVNFKSVASTEVEARNLKESFFESAAFEERIKILFGFESVTQEALESVGAFETSELDLSRSGITELTDLSYFTKLEKLNLAGNPIDSLEPLLGLQNLLSLNLSSTSIKDISSLGYLTKLKKLDISNNHIRDLKYIENLDLEVLNVAYNDVYNLSVIKNLKSLKELNLSGLPYQIDLTKLSSLKGLEILKISRTKVINESMLLNMKKLKNLVCSSMVEFDFYSLSDLDIEALDLSDNNLIDLGFMMNKVNLERLSLKNNRLSEDVILVIQSLSNLKDLNLEGNFISGDLDFRSNEKLMSVDLGNNALKGDLNIEFSEEADLRYIELRGNFISSLRFIGSNPSLRKAVIESTITKMRRVNEAFVVVN